MDIYYLKDHICEELDGSEEYLKKAIKLKDESLEWSKTFYDMSLMEAEHAKNLYRMFCDAYKKVNTDPTLEVYMEPFRDSVVDTYLERMGALKYM